MMRAVSWRHVQCTLLVIVALWPAQCRADEQARRLFGISIQAVPQNGVNGVTSTGRPLDEAPTVPPSAANDWLPGYSVNEQGLKEVKHIKKGFDKAQWLLLGQFLFVFWLLVGALLTAVFSLERCGIFESYCSSSCCPSCCRKLEEHWRMSKAFFNIFFVVLVLACAFTAFCVYEGLFTSAPGWFNRMERSEVALMARLPFQIPGLSPTTQPPAPTQPPTQRPGLLPTAPPPALTQSLANAAVATTVAQALAMTPPPTTQAPKVRTITFGAPIAKAVSPCVSATPPPFTQTPIPSVQNYMPPAACHCKASVAKKQYVNHCQTYPGLVGAVCVVVNPACSPNTVDAGQGNGDKLVKCIAAPEGSGTPYSVTLNAANSTSGLGMKIMPDPTVKNLLVTHITGGIVGTYNAAHPGPLRIKVGDMITAVNGMSGDSVKLLQECMKKEQLVLSMLRQVGYPISNAMPPTPAHTSKCPGSFLPWGQNSVCLSNAPGFGPGSFGWHCPWASMMLVSTKKFGGCAAVQYDCAGMNVDAVLDLYSKHDNMQTPPPEGSQQTVDYVSCCLQHQCRGQPLAKCGEAPWTQRRYSVTKVSNLLPKPGHPVLVVSGLSLLLVTGVVFAMGRRRGGDHHRLPASSDTEACTSEVE